MCELVRWHRDVGNRGYCGQEGSFVGKRGDLWATGDICGQQGTYVGNRGHLWATG